MNYKILNAGIFLLKLAVLGLIVCGSALGAGLLVWVVRGLPYADYFSVIALDFFLASLLAGGLGFVLLSIGLVINDRRNRR